MGANRRPAYGACPVCNTGKTVRLRRSKTKELDGLCHRHYMTIRSRMDRAKQPKNDKPAGCQGQSQNEVEGSLAQCPPAPGVDLAPCHLMKLPVDKFIREIGRMSGDK